jgi:hypothetical protein
MVNYSSEIDILSVIGSGKVLWHGRNGFEWIGPANEEWKDVYIVQYLESQFQHAIERFKRASLTDLNLLAVKPASGIKIKLLQYSMRFVLSWLPSKLTSDDTIIVEDLLDSLESPVLPSSKQFSRLFENGKGKYPVAMLNLLKYHSSPNYPLNFNGEEAETGAAAYTKYSMHAIRMVSKLGGYIHHLGKVEEPITGKDDDLWDEYAIMGYPTRFALQRMFTFKSRAEDSLRIHRDAGLEKTKVFALNKV